MAPGSTWVDLSSSSPTLIGELHARVAERSVEVLDAPVSGGPRAAVEGTQALMVGGDEARYEQLRPLLELMGDKVSRVGDVGAGSVAKLVHNLIAQCSRAAAVEGLLLGVKAGLDPLVLYRVLQDGAFGQNFFLKQSLPHHILAGQFETPRGGQGRARKDIALATGLARDLGVPMPIASLVEQLQIEAVRRGWSERNASAYVQLQEARAGVELRGEVPGGG
jgi:3-hydroxyisobutyrate dehydrogenase